MPKEAPKFEFIVVHGTVSGTKLGDSIELTQEQADHINEGGKMLRRFDEPEEERQRKVTVTRSGEKVGGKKKVDARGTVVSTEADGGPEDELEEPAPEPAAKPVKAPRAPAAKKKAGG